MPAAILRYAPPRLFWVRGHGSNIATLCVSVSHLSDILQAIFTNCKKIMHNCKLGIATHFGARVHTLLENSVALRCVRIFRILVLCETKSQYKSL